LRFVIGRRIPAADDGPMSTPKTLWILLAAAMFALAASGCGRDAAEQAGPGVELLQVAERGDLGALDALLRGRAQPDYRDNCDWTPLMKAAQNGHVDAVRRLLDAGANPDAADKGGYTALMLAASNNHADVVELLLSRGAMVDAQEQTQGFTALIWAAQQGKTEAVEALLRHGADKTLPDLAGKTALDQATENGQTAAQSLLAGTPTTAAATSPAR
jgi:ankyrin repeat protein